MPKDDPLRLVREHTATLVQHLAASAPPHQAGGMDKETLVRLGKTLWPTSYQGAGGDDAVAFNRFISLAEKDVGGFKGSPREQIAATIASAMLYLPMEQMTFFWAARWADLAFPTITMGHKYAAALMSTSISSDYAADVIPPFPAFLIEIPDGLLSVVDPNGGDGGARYLLAHYLKTSAGEFVWNYVIITKGPVSLWRHGVPTSSLTEADPENINTWDDYSFGLQTTQQDERVNIVAGRLILGTCLALSSKDSSRPVGKSHSKSVGEIRQSPEPLVRTFQVGTPIKIDCRQAVSDYIAGRRHTAPGVQVLVRGHWKRQPYGPQSSLRKWIHREPFWRGPEDAPILTRPIDLKGEGS